MLEIPLLHTKIQKMKLLENKTAVITGASRGIGRGIAEKYAAEGCNIAFSFASSVEKAKALEEELSSKYGVKVKGFQSNAADFTSAQTFIDAVVAEFGRIDILINNAGITRDNLLMRMSEEQWDEVINVNLKSVFNLTKASLRTFLGQKSGSIINMSSVVGVMGNAGQSNYAASKAGIIGFSKSLAKEVAHYNITVNTIAPGYFDIGMFYHLSSKQRKNILKCIPTKRLGNPNEISELIQIIISSSYTTGQTFILDGGYSI